MDDTSQLDDLLDRWEELRDQGREPSVEKLCADHPELADVVTERIQTLIAMDWLVDDDHEDSAPTTASAYDRTLPTTALTVAQFAESICTSKLLTPKELATFRRQSTSAGSADDARTLAEELVAGGKLTTYQAKVVLEERSDPLLIDRYIILDTVGAGGMGVVFKALHKSMDRIVALKILSPGSVDSSEKVQRFQREMQTAAKLAHPNVVTAFDADESDGTHFLVMEYVPGKDLSKVVLENGPLSVSQAVNCIQQAAQGLEHAHRHGIIHRDIKPANLLLSTDGTVKVADLGLAVVQTRKSMLDETKQELTQGDVLLGTVSYIAPEQALDTKRADERSDLYSLGATLHFLVTGRPPYAEENAFKTLLAHREHEIPSLQAVREGVPDELEVVLQRMMAKQPEHRYQSAAEVVVALEDVPIEEDDNPNPNSNSQPPINIPLADTDQIAAAIEETLITRPQPRSELPPRSGRGLGVWLIGLVAIGLLGAGALFAPTIFRVKTPAGTIFLEVDEADAEVRVDGQRVTIQQKGEKEPIIIDVEKGTHQLLVRKGGFKLYAKEFSVTSGQRATIKVRLEPLPAPPILAETDSIVGRLESAEKPLPGLVPHPAKKPGVRRWQIETAGVRNSDNNSLDWSPDGMLIACGTLYGAIRICDAESLELAQYLVGHTGGVNDVAWHPSGKLLASAGGDGTIRFWEADGRVFRQAMVLKGHSDVVTSVAWNQDGSLLASSSGDKTVRLWSADGTPGSVLKGHENMVKSVVWSPDGRQLASSDETAIQLWDADGSPGATIDSKLDRHLAWSPDGRQIASIDNREVKLWNVDGSPGPSITGHKSLVCDAAWSPNGKLLATVGDDSTMQVWKADGSLQGRFQHSDDLSAVAWSPDGQRLATVSANGMTTWSFRGKTLVHNQIANTHLPSLSWTPDGQTLACATRDLILLFNADGTLRTTMKEQIYVKSLAWSPDGTLLAAGDYLKSVRLWKADGTLKAELKGHTGPIVSVAWSPDGKQIASAGTDKTVRLWDTEGEAGRVFEQHTTAVTRVVWSPDGNQIVSTGYDGDVRIWPSEGDGDGRILRKVGWGTDLAWQPGGDWLAVAHYDRVLLQKLDGTKGPMVGFAAKRVSGIAWSPDGQQLAAADHSQWRASRLNLMNLDGSLGDSLDQQGSGAISVAWSSDGNRLAVSDQDGTIAVRDMATRQVEWKTLVLDDGQSITFEPDGRIRDGDAKTFEEQFVYIVEHDDGRFATLKPAEFEKLTVTDAAAAPTAE